MIPYFIILFMAIFMARISDQFRSVRFIYRFFIILNSLMLILFAGLRNSSVGTDTNGYVSNFLGKELVFSRIMEGVSSIEIGYQLLEFLVYNISNNYYFILLSIAFVFIFFSLKGIYKISITPSVSIFVFITFGIYTYIFNGARQGLALGIFIYAIQFIKNKQFFKYLIFIGLGFLFHKSIIFALPFYFLHRFKFNLKFFTFITLLTFILIIFFKNFMQFGVLVSEKYAVYSVLNARGGQMLTLAYILFGLFFILVKPFLNKTNLQSYDIYLNIFLIGPIIFIAVQFTGVYIEVTRLAIYFLSAAIFIWPLILKNIRSDLKPFVLLFFFVSNFLFYFIFINKMANLVPYKFNTQLFYNF